MWTPKRIALLVLGFVLLLAAYWTYARFLGGIDGLPALPEEYAYKDEGDGPPRVLPQPQPNELDDKLRLAFGEECPELSYAIKLEVRAKGMVVAAKEFGIMPKGGEFDGQVRLRPVSVALFGKNNGDGKFPEINTVRANEAYLHFDHPITNPAEMGKYKIIGGQVAGNVDIVNNRRTPQRDDDLTLFTHGPVFYKEADHLIWTEKEVKLKDLQSKPEPTAINAIGMEIRLAVEASQQPAAAPAKPQKGAGRKRMEAISGVEHIALRQDVVMHLYVDSNSGFLSTGRDESQTKNDKAPEKPKGQAEAAKAPERSHIVITTQGPFNYDVEKSHAQFDVSEHPSPYPNRVSVNRVHEFGQIDELDCERLELQFRPKDDKNPHAVRDDRSVELEIEHAHATGQEVMLKSDAEFLVAYGNDFFYDARTRQSTLKGQPEMWALKKGNEIHALEMRILEQKGAQQVTAIGPGRIALLDATTGKRPQHARWQDKLVSSKDGTYDLLVLTGDAAFIDDEHQQQLQADRLQVWLEPAQAKPDDKKDGAVSPGPTSEAAGEHQGRRPHHVEAIGHVVAHSQDLNIHDSEHLHIWFRDVPSGTPPAGPAPGAPAAATVAAPPMGQQPTPGKPDSEKPAGPAAPAATAAKPNDPAKPARPIDLTARLVEAHVLRSGPRSELDRLWTEGGVHVTQAPANAQDRGVDIQGETLQLTRKLEGNYLVVTGDLARLLLDKIFIVGPVVHIDQVTNKAWVNGIGAMQMDSDSNFQGRKLKEPVPLVIHWSKTMFFDGQFAEFHGGVQAEQENAKLLCQAMQAFLDRPVSLKEGGKNGPPAKVRKLVCDQAVRVEDTERDEKGQLVKYQRLECPELSVDNEENEVHASGPGVLRILQRGSASDGPLTPQAPGAVPAPERRPAASNGTGQPAAEDELKLTRVIYAGRMYANNKNHTAIFTDDVHVVNVPSEDPNLDPNLDKLPPGGMYLHSDKLAVYSQQDATGAKSNQEMKARGHCSFRTPDSAGHAEEINFDEAKDQVIFIGGEGGLAHLYREKIKGAAPEELKARKIIYIRKTGEFWGDRTAGVNGGGAP